MTEFGSVLYGDIQKVDDEKRIVEGFISADGCDLGGHIIDQTWLKNVLPAWATRWGNVREMHAPSAVGTVQQLDVVNLDRPWVAAHIVDDAAWKKVKAGVYKGFSVGIKNPIIVSDPNAPLGRIVGGDFLELSVVDRPANPDAVITLFKIAPGVSIRDEQHGVVMETAPAAAATSQNEGFVTGSTVADLAKMPQAQREVWKAIRDEYDGKSSADKSAPTPNSQNVLRLQMSNQLPYLYGPPGPMRTKAALTLLAASDALPLTADIAKTVADVLGVTPELIKREYTAEERKKYAESGIALPDGTFPIPDKPALTDALERLHQAGDKAAAAAHIRKRAKELGVKLPQSVEASVGVLAGGIGHVAPDVANAAKVVHPHSGEHAHAHTHAGFPPGISHTHTHSHNEDDMHEHDHTDQAGAPMEPSDVLASAAADNLKNVTLPDVAKSDPSFGYQNPAALPTLQKLETSLETLMKEVRSQIESLAGQTDKDRDGDIDTKSNMGPNGTGSTSGPAADFKSHFPTPTLPKPETLVLEMSPASDVGGLYPDLAKSIDALVRKRVDEAIAKIPTKTQTADVGALTADVAKAASVIAEQVGRLATGVGTIAEEQAKLRTQAEALAKRQEKVEQLAQPVRGQTAVADKVIGLPAPEVTKSAPAPSLEELVAQAQSLDPEKRTLAAQAMIAALYSGQRPR